MQIVHCNCVLKIVSPARELVIFDDAAIRKRTEFLALESLETLFETTLNTPWNLLGKTLGCVRGVCCWKNIFSLYARYEASVAGQALIADLVGGTVEPRLRIFTVVADHHAILWKLLMIVDGIWALIHSTGL